jgi:hypothetical protein
MIAAPTVEAIEVIVVDQSEPFLERDFLSTTFETPSQNK